MSMEALIGGEKIMKEATSKETIEDIVGQDSEPTDQKKRSKKTPDIITGVVVNCDALAIRKEPSQNSEIIHVIKSGETLIVNNSGATDTFHSVTVNSMISGFAMRKYIEA